MRDPATTASGLTVLTRMPNCPPSSAECQRRFLERRLHVGRVGAIHLGGARAPSTEVLIEVPSRLLAAGEVVVGGTGARALPPRAPTNGGADAARSTSYQHHLPRE